MTRGLVMNEKDLVVKHLEMIQGVINRLGHDSFLVKGWSMAILAAGVIFIARSEIQSGYMMLAFLVPVTGFWILDGYFLWQERLFRKLYDEVRKQATTDFSMDTKEYKCEPTCSWAASTVSKTLLIFYSIEILFVFGVFSIIQLNPGPC